MSRLMGLYKNGNYIVEIYYDGTKIRSNNLDNLTPAFAESCDITITNRCDGNCGFCYAGCTPEGKHGELLRPEFLDSLHPFTEVALNGNDLSHPQLQDFLIELRKRKVIPNITVHQRHFMKHFDTLKDWHDEKLVFGIGVSYGSQDPEFLEKLKIIPDVVIHTINGILWTDDIEFLADHDLKLLVLGYKNKGRGVQYLDEHLGGIRERQSFLLNNLEDLFRRFRVVSFDNLALEQLGVRSHLSDEAWNQIYMGDEGRYTFFIDLVKNTFAKSSLETTEYPMLPTVDEMFNFLQDLRRKEDEKPN